jgi:hypothetical protein
VALWLEVVLARAAHRAVLKQLQAQHLFKNLSDEDTE